MDDTPRHRAAHPRDAALLAGIPRTEYSVPTVHGIDLVGHVRLVLAAGADRYNRDRVLNVVKACALDTSNLGNVDGIAADDRAAPRGGAQCLVGGPTRGAATAKTHRPDAGRSSTRRLALISRRGHIAPAQP
ncbi:hypothetical protein ACFWXK_10495 [Streptomyces sp. NPDC059070]|uniref:hypothetical protein n=1 Tax=Streptomyces sp. NPDC059070 TaxID=3346713 RepID=UPI0036A9468F